MRARDLMQRDPITIRPDAPYLEIQRLFVEAQIGGAPLVDEAGHVHGLITTADLLRAVDELCDEDLDPAEPESEEALARGLGELTAHMLATPDPTWVSPDLPVAEVARTMREEGVHRVLVGTEGRLEGILTAFDLLGWQPT
ncbi:MAG: CBS domain-containing protein [Kofleriaceae bacterium]|nr:CBS domain-containing protein [Kofleriaceae bacterium]